MLELKFKDGTNKKFVEPITVFSFGNQVNISIAPFDNAIVGYNKNIENNQFNIDGMKVTYIVAYYSQQVPLLYTDAWGEVDNLTCKFTTIKNDIVKDIENGTWIGSWTKKEDAEQVGDSYKTLLNINGKQIIDILENNNIFSITHQQIQKDMMEKMSVNYAFEIKGDDCIVCEELARQSKLFTAETSGGIQLAFAPRILSETDKLDKIDGLTTINVSYTSVPQGQDGITYHFSSAPANYASVAVVKNGRMLLIFNKLNDNMKKNITNGNLTVYY